jgi:hypothetical protein
MDYPLEHTLMGCSGYSFALGEKSARATIQHKLEAFTRLPE